MTNSRRHGAHPGRVLTPVQGLVFAAVLCLVAFWLPVLALVGENL